jgi:sigma-B regulation protein RsbU (phosphoserine phosphatase)
MGILLAATVGYVTYTLNYRQVKASYTELAFNSAKMAAEIASGCDVDGYLLNGADDRYNEIFASLQTLKTVYGFEYLYIFRPDVDNPGGATYIFDIYIKEEFDPDFIAELGEYIEDVDVYDIVLEVFLTGHSKDSTIVTDTEFGHLASAYVAVYNAAGEITAVVGVDISMDVILDDVRSQTIQILGATVIIIALFLIIMLILLQKQMINHVLRLSQHMKGFSADCGELKEFDVVKTGDEIQDMSESFNRMVEALKLYVKNLESVTADRERIQTELNVATQIQASMLPCIFPAFPNIDSIDIFATMRPAKEVGGDFYDFFMFNKDTLAVVIADVSGKGVPAALFMVIAKTLIKNNAYSGKSPKEVFETVNNTLCENNDAGMFVTGFMGYLDIHSGEFTFVNAGHNPPVLIQGGEVKWLKSKVGFVLAGMEGMKYTQSSIQLNPDDTLFLYTDGVTEADNHDKELFGDPRLLEVVERIKEYELPEFTKSIEQEIDKFADGAEQADDITMLVLKFKGKN